MLHVPVGMNTFGLMQPSSTARPAAAQGTSITPTVGSKGSWTSIITALTNDCYAIAICINSNSGSAASRNTVVDIGVDDTGGTSYAVKIPDLIAGGAGTYVQGGLWYVFPLFIPKGARIAARADSTVVTAFRVYIQTYQQPVNPSAIKKGSFVEAIGVSGNTGTSLTAGTTSEGAWTLLGTTTNKVWHWQVGVQVISTDTSWNAAAVNIDLAVGNGTLYDIIILDMPILFFAAELIVNVPLTLGQEFPVAGGVNVYARAQTSGTADPFRITAYAMGG